MNREDLRKAAKEIVEEFPDIGRRELGYRLGVSEDTARHLKDEAADEILVENPPEPENAPSISVAYFDLETTDLSGCFGQLLCGSVWSSKPGTKMVTHRIDEMEDKKDFTDDRSLALAIRNHLEEHRMSVGYFSKGFDVPFLNARLAEHGDRLLSSEFHFDPIWHFKGFHGLKLRSSRMKVVAEFLKIERKQDVDIDVWKKCLVLAAQGDSEKMDIIVDRCESDVRITAKIAEWCWNNGKPKAFQRYP